MPTPAGVDPYQILIIGFPANATAGSPCPAGDHRPASAALRKASTSRSASPAAPRRDASRSSSTTMVRASPTRVPSRPREAHCTVTRAPPAPWRSRRCGGTRRRTAARRPAQLEPYSAKGGDPILFDTAGARNATPVMRQKPDIAGPDGGNDTFLGFVVGGCRHGQLRQRYELSELLRHLRRHPARGGRRGPAAAEVPGHRRPSAAVSQLSRAAR